MIKIERQQVTLDQFWNLPIDFDDEDSSNTLVKDIAPFIVLEDTAMSKLHFLFIMLNIAQVNIVKEGVITGIISKLEFLKKRKEEAQIMRKEAKRRRLVDFFIPRAGHAFENTDKKPRDDDSPVKKVLVQVNS